MSSADLAQRLAQDAENVCRYLLPNGVRRGREWKVGSVSGEAGESMGVVLSGEKAGVFQDFASGESGDLLGLWKAVRGVDIATACREVEEWLGIAPHVNGKAHARVVAAKPEPTHTHPRLGVPSQTWAYRDASGGILGYISRFDPKGERKQILPQSWDGSTWNWKAFPEPRPLYGLERLAARPDAPVLIVEGEKCADVAARLIPAMVVVSWPGGCKALDKVDFSPLRGRVTTLWPDADEPGKEAMERIAERLGQACRIVRPNGHADGWDIADAAAEGWDGKQVVAWAKEHVEHWFPPAEPHPGVVTDFEPGPMLDSEAHPDPIDLFDAPILPRLDRMYLPSSFAAFILDQSEIIGSDPGILAISAMVSAAAVTHDRIKAQPKRYEYGWRESARLWGTFVGDPSVKKTPPLNRATAHLRKMNMQFAEEGQDAMRRYKIARKVYDAAERHYIDAQAKNKPCAPLYEAPEKPPIRRVIVQDATIEALSDILVDNDGGILVLFDELSGFFGSMDAYRAVGGKDRSFWLESYNGGPRQIDRVSREAMPVPNLSTNILGGIQPAAMKEQAKKMTDDGLLQRFMIVVAQPVKGSGVDRAPDQGAVDAYREILDFLSTQRGDPDRPLTFDDDAREVLKRVEAKLSEFQSLATLPMRMRYHLGKWSGLFVRLCLLYYAIECAALKQPVAGEIDGDTAQRVERFMFEYLFWHLQYFYEQILGEVGGSDDVTRIANLILAHRLERLTTADISRNIKAWRAAPRHHRDAVFDQLEIAGWIMPDRPDNRTGVRAWRVNPRVHEQFAERAEQERQRRAVAKAAILAGIDKRRESE